MKKLLLICTMIMLCLISIGCLTACEQTTEDASKVTVSWYQGSKIIAEDRVEKGSVITAREAAEIAGKEFKGWFAEASLTVEFDFTKPIEEDTDIFAKYVSNVFEADENEYYLIGTGAGDMKKSTWDHTNSMANLMMVKQENATANIYEITLRMYAGDAFQICYGGSYDGQVGIGYILGAEYADGINGYDKIQYTAADKKYAVVKDAEGNVIFEGSDEFNKEFYVWNAFLAEGHDGIYKITYTTYPTHKEDNTITYQLVEEIEPLAVTHEMYIRGTMNNWECVEEYKMTADDTKQNFSFLLNILPPAQGEEETLAEFKVCNNIDDKWYGVPEEQGDAPWTLGTGSENLKVEPGVYKVEYSVEKDEAVVTPVEKSFWLSGVLNGADYWDCKSGIEFEMIDNTNYKAYYTFKEKDTKDWMGDSVGACKASYGYAGWETEEQYWYGVGKDNLMIDSYGLYEIVLTLNDAEDFTKGGTLAATKLEGYFLVGTIGDGDTWRAEPVNKITVGADGAVKTEYTWEKQDSASWLGADEIAAIKILHIDDAGNETWYGNGKNNVVITEIGTYSIEVVDGNVVATKK